MYQTPSLTVHVGTTVTWINSDGSIPHTVTAGWPDSESAGVDYLGGNGFDSDFMSGGATFEHTFEVPEEYDYYCQLYPWMTGTITVEYDLSFFLFIFYDDVFSSVMCTSSKFYP